MCFAINFFTTSVEIKNKFFVLFSVFSPYISSAPPSRISSSFYIHLLPSLIFSSFLLTSLPSFSFLLIFRLTHLLPHHLSFGPSLTPASHPASVLSCSLLAFLPSFCFLSKLSIKFSYHIVFIGCASSLSSLHCSSPISL